ncbi:MAG TPA: hypothetical protein VGX76_16895 [Pirellulales bacterium]|nr:hypothetical protein [Pirellulales bacterium]
MSFGLTILTFVHVLMSLVGIAAGLAVAYGFLRAKRLDVWTAAFLTTTVLTSVIGFFFPFERFLPSHALGILSLVVLAVAIVARHAARLAGPWRAAYVVSSVIALYFNVFVLVVQLFQKVPALGALAPTQSEPPFVVSQVVVLALFVALAIGGSIRFRGESITRPGAAKMPKSLTGSSLGHD